MEVTLTRVFRSWKDKEGNDLVSKSGRKYEKVLIKCQEYGDRWVSGFGSKSNQNWKEGDTVNIVVEEKGEYLNFKTVETNETSDNSKVMFMLELIDKKLEAINKKISPTEKDATPDSDDINPDEIPF